MIAPFGVVTYSPNLGEALAGNGRPTTTYLALGYAVAVLLEADEVGRNDFVLTWPPPHEVLT